MLSLYFLLREISTEPEKVVKITLVLGILAEVAVAIYECIAVLVLIDVVAGGLICREEVADYFLECLGCLVPVVVPIAGLLVCMIHFGLMVPRTV